MQIAAILLELSRYGATVDIMRPAAEALYEDIEEGGESVFLATTSEGFSFLQVAWKEDSETGRFIDAEVQFFDQTEFTEEDELLYGPSSSILINMNRVMDRVYDVRT